MSSGDLIAMGGAGATYEPDALSNYASSAETSTRPVLETDITYPVGDSGQCVVRRIYPTVEWTAGLSITITPIVDGVEITNRKVTFNRNGSGRETFVVKLSVKGSAVSAKVVAGAAPTGSWWLERKLDVHHIPGTHSKPAATS